MYIQISGARHWKREQQVVCANEFLMIATFCASLANFAAKNPWRFFLKLVCFGARYVRPLFSNNRFDRTKPFHCFSFQTQENCIGKAWYSRNILVTIPWR
jgi:hypothetical protein